MTLNRIATSTGLGIAFAVLALAAVGSIVTRPLTVAAAPLDCENTVILRVEIYDDGRPNINGGLLSLGGAYVDFSDNIQTGGFEQVRYYDNGPFDDDDQRGVIEERTACTDTDGTPFRATLGFRENLDCTAITPTTQDVYLVEDTTLEYVADDCVRVEPTATATAVPPTATTVPATATAIPTATAVPTSQPVREVKCDDGSVKVVPVNFTGQICNPVIVPTSPPVVIAPTLPPTRITAPNTGSAGLLEE